MKEVILRNWNFMRFVRLGLGLAILLQSVLAKDWATGILGFMFAAMAVFNFGCCGTAGCYTPTKKTVDNPKEISYEEVV